MPVELEINDYKPLNLSVIIEEMQAALLIAKGWNLYGTAP